MDPKTNKLLQQAGKYVLLGKLTLALEQYLKIHELEPEDPTIMNTIGDLYNKMEDREQALAWYQRLADTFECRDLAGSAIAIYRKILKLAPKSQEAMVKLARLYENQGQLAGAKLQYKVIATQWTNLGEFEKALEFYTKICELHPNCPDSQLELAQVLEKANRLTEASHAYLKTAELLAKQGNATAAANVVENLFRLKPRDKEFVKTFFNLLRDINLTERGVDYLQSVSLDGDPDFKAMLGDVFVQDGNFEVAQKFLLSDVRGNPKMYPATMKMLQKFIEKGELNTSLDIVDAIFDTAIQQHDEINLKMRLDTMLELDPTNIRTLKTLTTLLIRVNDKDRLEQYLKQLVVLQLQTGNLREARDTFNKMVVYGQNSFYLDLLNDLNDAMVSGNPEALKEISQKVIRALENGSAEPDECTSGLGLALGVSDLDLGLAMGIQIEEDLVNEVAS